MEGRSLRLRRGARLAASLTALVGIAGASWSGAAQDAQSPPAEKDPRPQATAGKYTIHVDGIAPAQFAGGGFAAGGAFGGSFSSGGPGTQGAVTRSQSRQFTANSMVALTVTASKPEELLMLGGIAPRVRVVDDRGSVLEALVMPGGGLLPPAGKQGVPGRQERILLNLPEPRPKNLQSLEGSLLVAQARIAKLAFDARSLQKGASRKEGGLSATLDDIRQDEEGITVELTLALPAPPPARDPLAALTAMARQPAVIAVMADNDGLTYGPTAMASGGGFAGGFYYFGGASSSGQRFSQSGTFGNFGPGGGARSIRQSYRFPAPVGNGRPDSLTLHVITPTGDPKPVPFKVTSIPVPEK